MRIRPDATSTSAAVAALAVIALIAAACGSATPTPTPAPATPAATATASSGPAASGSPGQDLVSAARAIEAQVAAIRGLPQKSPVDPKALDSAGLTAYIEKDFAKENSADRIAADERLAKLLGLLPADSSLADLYKELLTSQVVGLYSPDDKALYVLQTGGALGPAERMIFAHEFTHALQDQHFDLLAYSKATDDRMQGDRALARTSLVEGDATAVMSIWAQSNLTLDELLKVAQTAADPKAAAIMAKMPPILRETSLFPYQQGATFVGSLFRAGSWGAIDKAYTTPPDSTEQVMHSAKYLSREAPVTVTMPSGLLGRLGSGWSIGTEDTYGEFQLQVWLRGPGGTAASAATTAAAGWGGDRLALLDGPGGARGAVLLSAWDTAQDASEFAAAARTAIDAYKVNALVVDQPGSKTVTVLAASDDTVLDRLYQILGASGV